MTDKTKKPSGSKREAWQRQVRERLASYGYTRRHYAFHGSTLMVSVDGEIRELRMHCNMSRLAMEFEFGRLWAWADMIGLHPKVSRGGTTAADLPKSMQPELMVS